MALVIVPGLSHPVSPVAAVTGLRAPRAVEACRVADEKTVGAGLLRDTGWERLEDGDGSGVDIDVLDVDLIVKM